MGSDVIFQTGRDRTDSMRNIPHLEEWRVERVWREKDQKAPRRVLDGQKYGCTVTINGRVR